MTLKDLLKRLPEDALGASSFAMEDATINGIKLLAREQTDIKPDILYFCSSVLLSKMSAPKELFNCLCFGREPVPAGFADQPNVNMTELRPGVDPFICYNIIQDYFVEDQALSGMIKRLLYVLLENEGLAALIDEAYDIFQNPIFVIDQSFKISACHVGPLPEDDPAYRTKMEQEMTFGSVLETGVNYIRENRLSEQVSSLGKPLLHYHEYFGRNVLIAAVHIRGIEVAHIMMIEQNRPFTPNDIDCFARLALFVGQELQKDPFYQKNRGQMYSYFLINLLEDPQPSLIVIDRRMEALHFEPLDKYFVVTIEASGDVINGQDLGVITGDLRGVLTGNIYALYHNCLVILFKRKKDAPLGEYTEGVLRQYAVVNRLTVGVSNEFSDLTQIRRYYEQALTASRFGRQFPKMSGEGPLFYYYDYAYMSMLDMTSGVTDLMSFCHPRLIALMQHDKESGSDLMGTFFEYLKHSSNTQRTAKALFIHKNTLLYRLEHIKGILGNDLSSGEDLFMFHLSFRILIYLGLYKPLNLHPGDQQNG